MAIAKHGITTTTPSNILLGAGTFYKGLTYTAGASGAAGSWGGTVLGATSGGGKISIKGELMDLDLDGALVKFKGQTIKQGGTASAEVNFAEVSKDILKMATLFTDGTSADNSRRTLHHSGVSWYRLLWSFSFVPAGHSAGGIQCQPPGNDGHFGHRSADF